MSEFNSDGCPLKHTVRAHPRGTSMNGVGCLHTGGHCLPCDDCPNRINIFLEEEQRNQQLEDRRKNETRAMNEHFTEHPHG